MSFPRESNKDESFPWISSNNMAKWDILLRAYLKPKKNADRALDEDRPSPDETKLRRIVRAGGTGSGNQDLTLFRKQLRLLKLRKKKIKRNLNYFQKTKRK